MPEDAPAPGQDRARLPVSLRAYVAAVTVLGVGGLVAVGAIDRWRVGRPVVLLVLLVLYVLDQAFPVLLPHGTEGESQRLEEAYFAAAAFLLPPFGVLAVIGIGTLAGDLLQRLPPVKAAFNIGQFLLSATVALATIHLLDPASDGGAREVAAVAAGSLVFSGANALMVAMVFRFLQRTPAGTTLREGLATRAAFLTSAIAAGLLAGLVTRDHLWAFPIGLAGILGVRVTLGVYGRAYRDHQRMEALLASTVRVHAEMGREEVRDALLAATRTLLRSPHARLGPEEPRPDELAARVECEVAPAGWLAVSGRRSNDPYDEDDRSTLAALAAVGASAIDNAVLFEERGRLLAGLVEAQEAERRRIAADIHDDSIQAVTSVAMRLGILRRRIPDDHEQQQTLADLERTVQETIHRLRYLLFNLRPPTLDRQGLAAALETYVQHVASLGGTAYRIENHLQDEPSEEVRVILYRLAQEALANVVKHADASSAVITLEQRDGGYEVRIRDDGRGFDPRDETERLGHLGLTGMRERVDSAGGSLRIESAPGEGTEVEFWVPAVEGPATAP